MLPKAKAAASIKYPAAERRGIGKRQGTPQGAGSIRKQAPHQHVQERENGAGIGKQQACRRSEAGFGGLCGEKEARADRRRRIGGKLVFPQHEKAAKEVSEHQDVHFR
jgi:hypothetical protein